jgi:hypothetical protein
MADLATLETRARSAAEWGRARMAARVGLVVVPFAAVSIAASGVIGAGVALGALLLVVAFLLRFWHRDGVEAVRLGLTMGLVPLVAALLLRACGIDCAPMTRFSEAELVCVLAGVAAGAGVAVQAATGEAASVRTWAAATSVASLAAALGCVGLGLGGLLVTVAALVASSLAVAAPLRSRLA